MPRVSLVQRVDVRGAAASRDKVLCCRCVGRALVLRLLGSDSVGLILLCLGRVLVCDCVQYAISVNLPDGWKRRGFYRHVCGWLLSAVVRAELSIRVWGLPAPHPVAACGSWWLLLAFAGMGFRSLRCHGLAVASSFGRACALLYSAAGG